MLPPRADNMLAHFPLGSLAVMTRESVENGAMLAQCTEPLVRVAEDELAGRVNIDALAHQDPLQIVAAGDLVNRVVKQLVEGDKILGGAGGRGLDHLLDDGSQPLNP